VCCGSGGLRENAGGAQPSYLSSFLSIHVRTTFWHTQFHKPSTCEWICTYKSERVMPPSQPIFCALWAAPSLSGNLVGGDGGHVESRCFPISTLTLSANFLGCSYCVVCFLRKCRRNIKLYFEILLHHSIRWCPDLNGSFFQWILCHYFIFILFNSF
jgi:hypothetical protein